MMFIVRLTDGNCVIAMAADERSAGESALKLSLDKAAEVATIRPLEGFAVQLTPTEDGSLEATHWDDATLESILAHEYPLLNEAYRRANGEPLMPAAQKIDESSLSQLHAAYQRNLEKIREGLGRELQRPVEAELVRKSKALRR
ncbi:MAG: hypothetical protein ACLQLC_16480 [Candidatus Sulfotelmatobacter sp.]